jgi:hypothetical protein
MTTYQLPTHQEVYEKGLFIKMHWDLIRTLAKESGRDLNEVINTLYKGATK